MSKKSLTEIELKAERELVLRLAMLRKQQERKYFNDTHRKKSEAAQREVEEMSKNPMTREQKIAQTKRRTSPNTEKNQ